MLCLRLDMSRFISALLEKEKNSVRSTLEKLESATGEKYIDSHLTSEIIVNSKRKLKELGLHSGAGRRPIYCCRGQFRGSLPQTATLAWRITGSDGFVPAAVAYRDNVLGAGTHLVCSLP